MEPPIIALAREMRDAADASITADGIVTRTIPFADMQPHWRRMWLAAALVARPDLADARVPKGHWASGLLKEEP